MLNKGFTLFELLLCIAIFSLISLSIMSFYSTFYLSIVNEYKRYRLQEITNQVISGLIKDIKRAGFIVNAPNNIAQPSIEINQKENCIMLRYDLTSIGIWRYDNFDPKLSDVFTYRFNKKNIEYQTGAENCTSVKYRWDKMFDPKEVIVTHFNIKNQKDRVKLQISVALKKHPATIYTTTRYITNENWINNE